MVRKWKTCKDRKATAEAYLDQCPYTVEELEAMWQDQVAAQTKPLANATAGLAKNIIKEILGLLDYSKEITREIGALDREIAAGNVDDVDDSVLQRAELVGKKESVEVQIRKKKMALGVTEKQNLKQLLDNKYLQVSTYQTVSISIFTSSLGAHASQGAQRPHKGQAYRSKI